MSSNVIPPTHTDILDKPGFAHVATTGPHGEPQSTPVWYSWDGEHFRFSQTKTRQKYRNLRRDPRIALSVTDPDNPYRYVEIRGSVESIEDDADRSFIDSLAKRYLNQDVYPWHQAGDERVVVTVRPERTSWMG